MSNIDSQFDKRLLVVLISISIFKIMLNELNNHK